MYHSSIYVNNGQGYALLGQRVPVLLSSQFCCKPKTALKKGF